MKKKFNRTMPYNEANLHKLFEYKDDALYLKDGTLVDGAIDYIWVQSYRINKARIVWELHHGFRHGLSYANNPVKFKDGNPRNLRIENLHWVSRDRCDTIKDDHTAPVDIKSIKGRFLKMIQEGKGAKFLTQRPAYVAYHYSGLYAVVDMNYQSTLHRTDLPPEERFPHETITHNLGRFNTIEEAQAAADKWNSRNPTKINCHIPLHNTIEEASEYLRNQWRIKNSTYQVVVDAAVEEESKDESEMTEEELEAYLNKEDDDEDSL